MVLSGVWGSYKKEHSGARLDTVVTWSRAGKSQPLITQEAITELVLVRHCSGIEELQETNSLSVLVGLQ